MKGKHHHGYIQPPPPTPLFPPGDRNRRLRDPAGAPASTTDRGSTPADQTRTPDAGAPAEYKRRSKAMATPGAAANTRGCLHPAE